MIKEKAQIDNIIGVTLFTDVKTSEEFELVSGYSQHDERKTFTLLIKAEYTLEVEDMNVEQAIATAESIDLQDADVQAAMEVERVEFAVLAQKRFNVECIDVKMDDLFNRLISWRNVRVALTEKTGIREFLAMEVEELKHYVNII